MKRLTVIAAYLVAVLLLALIVVPLVHAQPRPGAPAAREAPPAPDHSSGPAMLSLRQPVTGSITLYKVDQNGTPLANVCFQTMFLGSTGTERLGFLAGETTAYCTGFDGFTNPTFGLAVPGTYVFTEIGTTVPAGCAPLTESVSVALTAENPTQTVTVTNDCTPANTPTPTNTPTATPTDTPTTTPTATPTDTPSTTPTATPTGTPTTTPTATPTSVSTATPTNTPASSATNTPTLVATDTPTLNATATPTSMATNTPTTTPGQTPTAAPTTPATPTTPTATSTPPATGTLVIDKILCVAFGPDGCASAVRDATLAGYAVTFTVVGPDDYGQAVSLTLADATGSVTVPALAPGVYTVCEIPVARKGARQVSLAVAEPDGCQHVTLASEQKATVTFHDALRAPSTLTPAPTATAHAVVRTLPRTGAGAGPDLSTGLWVLIAAAVALLLAGALGIRRGTR